jgi:hypothetical protein
MKITVIATASAALLGVFLCQPAVAKGSDVPPVKRQINNVKQDVKGKAKKPAAPAKTAKKKPVVKAKPALTKAPAKNAKPIEASSAKPSPANVVVKQASGKAAAPAPARPVRLADKVAKNDAADGLPPFLQANRLKFGQNERMPAASTTVAKAPCQTGAKAVSIMGDRHSTMAEDHCNPQSLGSPAEPGNANLVTFVGKPSVAPPRQSGESAFAGQTPVSSP